MPQPGTKILIIDYEPRGIKQMSDPLTEAGYEVLVAKDGLQGITAFETEKPDLVLIEAMLPKRHGFEVCQELKQTPQGRDTPIVVVTGVYKGRKYRTQAIHQHGAADYLEKPVPAELLLSTVDRLLSGKPQAVPATPATQVKPTVQSTRPAKPPANDVEAEISEHIDDILGGGKL
jgi:DNA-binding response OmpR family regulator